MLPSSVKFAAVCGFGVGLYVSGTMIDGGDDTELYGPNGGRQLAHDEQKERDLFGPSSFNMEEEYTDAFFHLWPQHERIWRDVAVKATFCGNWGVHLEANPPERWVIGSRVMALFDGHLPNGWHPGTIVKCGQDVFDVDYDDGDQDRALNARHITAGLVAVCSCGKSMPLRPDNDYPARHLGRHFRDHSKSMDTTCGSSQANVSTDLQVFGLVNLTIHSLF